MNEKSAWRDTTERKKRREEKVTISIEETGQKFEIERRHAFVIMTAINIFTELEKIENIYHEDIREIANILTELTLTR